MSDAPYFSPVFLCSIPGEVSDPASVGGGAEGQSSQPRKVRGTARMGGQRGGVERGRLSVKVLWGPYFSNKILRLWSSASFN